MRQHRVADSGSMGWLPQTAYKDKSIKIKRVNLFRFAQLDFMEFELLLQRTSWDSNPVWSRESGQFYLAVEPIW